MSDAVSSFLLYVISLSYDHFAFMGLTEWPEAGIMLCFLIAQRFSVVVILNINTYYLRTYQPIDLSYLLAYLLR